MVGKKILPNLPFPKGGSFALSSCSTQAQFDQLFFISPFLKRKIEGGFALEQKPSPPLRNTQY
jgi:hypothetical protein